MLYVRVLFFLLICSFSYASSSRAYVGMSGQQVAVVDIGTNTLLYKIPVGGNTGEGIAVTPDGRKVYIGCSSVIVAIRQIDTVTNQVTTVLPGVESYGIAISDKGIAYISAYNQNRIIVLNTLTNEVITTITSSQFNKPDGIFISKDGTIGYVVNNTGGSLSTQTLSRFDMQTNQVIGNAIQVGAADPEDVVATTNNQKAYVVCENGGRISFIDLTTLQATLLPYSLTGPKYCAISPDNSTVYVTTTIGDVLYFLDTATNTITSSLYLGVGAGAIGMSYDGSKLYITTELNLAGSYVSVVDTRTRSIITQISLNSVGTTAGGIAVYDPNLYLNQLKATQYSSIKIQKGIVH